MCKQPNNECKLLVNIQNFENVDFHDFCQCSHCFIKERIFGGPYSDIPEVFLLYFVDSICFDVIHSLPFETLPVMVRTT